MGCFATTAVSVEKNCPGFKTQNCSLERLWRSAGDGNPPCFFVQREQVRSKENEKLLSYATNRLMSFCWANCHNAAAIIGYFHKENRQYRGRQAILRTESSFTENDLQHFWREL